MDLIDILDGLTPEQIESAVRAMDPSDAQAILEALEQEPSDTPLAEAQRLDPLYRERVHLKYLSDRLATAMKKVEQGESQFIVVSMPPRSGKSQLTSVYMPVWCLHRHPDWPIGLISYDPSLAVKWGREVRAVVEDNADKLGITLARDSGAAAEWETTEKGGVLSRSHGQSVTGRGFKVLIVDDPVKDFADAHSPARREALWNWWIANASTRANGPWLVVFIGTRWHEDDVIGRLLSDEYEGDPKLWQNIKFPAIAEDADVLGRQPGEPLFSPILEETPEEALKRWDGIKATVGTYNWSALYQQSPSPAKGMIFDSDWWRFWTINPANASRTEDGELDPMGKVILLPDLSTARWTDSWDMAFKATSSSDYVVGQRWAMVGQYRFLMYQERARRTFTQTLERLKAWKTPEVPYHDKVFEHLVEDKANGTAVLNTLRETISGMIPVNPTESKEARARATTPECESGHVLLPYVGDPGNEIWVPDLLSELREFPTGSHDDQVDGLTQYLNHVRMPLDNSRVNTPVQQQIITQRRGQVALAQQSRYKGMVNGGRR